MNNKKIIITVITVITLVFCEGNSKPPKVSGNIEQGSRYALPYENPGTLMPWIEATEEDAQESWAYDFRKGYLQIYQKLNKRVKYTLRYNYIKKDFYAAETNNKNDLNYYRIYSWLKLSNALNLKVEYYMRRQVYAYRPWDNIMYTPNMQLRWDIDKSKKRRANLFIKNAIQRYEDNDQVWKDKDNLSARVNYQEEIYDRLLLKAQYAYTYRHYPENPDESNAVKKSMSAGFEYQF